MERYSPLAGGPDMLLPEPDADTAAAGGEGEEGVRGERRFKVRMDWYRYDLREWLAMDLDHQ